MVGNDCFRCNLGEIARFDFLISGVVGFGASYKGARPDGRRGAGVMVYFLLKNRKFSIFEISLGRFF